MIACKALVLTTGLAWQRFRPMIDQFEGRGVFYGSATTEALSCRGQEVYVVGAGNSAGQAVIFLAQYALACGAGRPRKAHRREDVAVPGRTIEGNSDEIGRKSTCSTRRKSSRAAARSTSKG